jgi:dTDP-4-amino-4,6-dideoxy-D-glucose transaminase
MSFHATKVFNTFEGGAIVCHSAEMKDRIDRLRNFGIVNEAQIEDISLNGKLSEVHAALGLLQLKTIDQTLNARKMLDHAYRNILEEVKGITCIARPDIDQDNYAYFPIIVEEAYALSRDELFVKFKEHNIFVRKYFYPIMTDLTIYMRYQSDTPEAKFLSERVLCLPLYPNLSHDLVQKIIDLIEEN